MNQAAFHPEDKARSLIDARLTACGWRYGGSTKGAPVMRDHSDADIRMAIAQMHQRQWPEDHERTETGDGGGDEQQGEEENQNQMEPFLGGDPLEGERGK